MERESPLHRERHESRAGSTYRGFLRDVTSLGGLDESLAEKATVSVLCAIDRRIRVLHEDLFRIREGQEELRERVSRLESEAPRV